MLCFSSYLSRRHIPDIVIMLALWALAFELSVCLPLQSAPWTCKSYDFIHTWYMFTLFLLPCAINTNSSTSLNQGILFPHILITPSQIFSRRNTQIMPTKARSILLVLQRSVCWWNSGTHSPTTFLCLLISALSELFSGLYLNPCFSSVPGEWFNHGCQNIQDTQHIHAGQFL